MGMQLNERLRKRIRLHCTAEKEEEEDTEVIVEEEKDLRIRKGRIEYRTGLNGCVFDAISRRYKESLIDVYCVGPARLCGAVRTTIFEQNIIARNENAKRRWRLFIENFAQIKI